MTVRRDIIFLIGHETHDRDLSLHVLGYAYYKSYAHHQSSFSGVDEILRDWDRRDRKLIDDNDDLWDYVDHIVGGVVYCWHDEGCVRVDVTRTRQCIPFLVEKGLLVENRQWLGLLSPTYSISTLGKSVYANYRYYIEDPLLFPKHLPEEDPPVADAPKFNFHGPVYNPVMAEKIDTVHVTQSGSQTNQSIDFDALLRELQLLEASPKWSGGQPGHILAIRQAEAAVKAKDEKSLLQSLASAGKWAKELAADVGAKLLETLIVRAMGIH